MYRACTASNSLKIKRKEESQRDFEHLWSFFFLSRCLILFFLGNNLRLSLHVALYTGMYAAMDALNLHDGREIEFQRLITGQSQMQRMKQLDEEADKFVACVYEWLKEEERPPEEPTIFKKKCPMRPDVGKNPESGGINMKEFVETVPSADGNLLYEHVLSGLKSDEALPVTILTGVSGAGKTKIAYDVSVEYGFPIMCRVYDQGALRETWEDLQIFLRLSEQIFEGRSVNDDFVRRYCIAAQKLLLMSFLEWAIQAGELIQQHMQKDEREDERLLRRNLLVCQRNGTAERMVCVLFKANLLNANQTDITKRNPDVLNEYVATVYNALKKRADSILPKQRLLWTFDEAQVLIDYPNTIRELPEERKPDVDYDRTTHYHLLSMAINYLFTASEICHSHVILCGTGLKLTANSMATVSPLQGYTKEFRIATRFTHSEVRRLLSGYLKPTALEAFKDEILDWWSGRPLYCSNLLYYLHHLHKEETIQQMTRNCQKRVLEDAIERMRKLTCVRLQKRIDTPQDLLLKLYHSLIMGEWSPEVEVADHCPAVHQARCLSYG